ncbi:winged helix-turn-helix domain-containing protein [Acidaminobacter hydrogenoformans]|uniref:Molybdate transport system regulatory protein n=1 Tax=Acidaminobacter hydrogenoformans DSM 2784 TaxID=1120920 RepID=A0A1G5RZY5_9FIRM|nr:LysR family transcriptional regulator [Acidaminobacter hydrogenoformans]SCZ78899.1 molybdate transport system regulatory protein [Acidaminobacter hydrogenoformans DSM 2784]
MEAQFKIWLGDEGEKILGNGPVALLKGIEATGSLSASSRQMGMSYSKAWHVVRRLERHLGLSLVVKRVGGSKGGGATLTPEAHELIRRYEAMCAEVEKFAAQAYDRHLGQWLEGRPAQE